MCNTRPTLPLPAAPAGSRPKQVGVRPKSFAIGLFAVLLAASCDISHREDTDTDAVQVDPGVGSPDNAPSDARTAIGPEARDLWEGTWYQPSLTSLQDNVYFRLEISRVDERGFEYELESRVVPYGPNATRSSGHSARFESLRRAVDPATGHIFQLTVDPADRQARVIDALAGEPSTAAPSAEGTESMAPLNAAGKWILDRPTYRAGFDCDQAATAVEIAICGNEVLARGDLEMNTLYRKLIKSAAPDATRSLRSSQRGFLAERERDCRSPDDVDERCLARLYADRIVALQRLEDPSLGSGQGFDAEFAKSILNRGVDLCDNTAALLAMYPLKMKEGTVEWRSDESGLLYENKYVRTQIVWPVDIEILYSDVFYIGYDGRVFVGAHMTPADIDEYSEIEPWRIELAAGRDFLTTWPAVDESFPDLVRQWLDRHPVPEFDTSLG